MHAPATPGDSVPGDAAGDDSEQGSGSSGEETPAVEPTVDAIAFETKIGYYDAVTEGEREFFTKENRAPLRVLLFGSNLDKLPELRVEYIFDVRTYDQPLVFESVGPDDEYIFKCDSADGMSDIAVNKIYGDGVVLYDGTSVPLMVNIEVDEVERHMGTVTGGGYHQYNETVTLSAVANPGYHFKQWSNGSTDNPIKFTARKNQTLVAKFEADEVDDTPEQVTLTLNCDNDFVSAPSGSGTYEKGTTVTIEAVAEDESPVSGGGQTQYTFKDWSDGSTERVRTIVLNEDLTLTANYQQNYVML